MTSFLAFSWRRRQSNVSSSDKDRDDAPLSPAPPTVTASYSGDTLSDANKYIKIARQRTPTTPEGLLPRRPASFLRRDLGLPEKSDGPHRRDLGLPENSDGPHQSFAVLPTRPSESWLTQGILASPFDDWTHLVS
jgi:hypothetical protein